MLGPRVMPVLTKGKRNASVDLIELDIIFKLLATILLSKCLFLVLIDRVVISDLIISTLIGFIVGSFYIANILRLKYKYYIHKIK